MEDKRAVQEIIREVSNIEKSNQYIINSIASIELLQVLNQWTSMLKQHKQLWYKKGATFICY